jgi:hypothetical protein
MNTDVLARVLAIGAFIVAAYAAGVSTYDLVWRVRQAKGEKQLRVQVELDEERVHLGTEGDPYVYEFSIKVINRSTFPVHVVGATVRNLGDPTESYTTGGPGTGLAHRIAPQDAHEISFPVHQLAPHLHSGFLQAWILLSTGEEFTSDPMSPSPDVTAMIGIHLLETIDRPERT